MADAKITELTEETVIAETDLVVIVDDPAGTPVTKKMTKGNLMAPLVREDADTIAQRRGGNNQVGYMYNTFTDTSNYSRARYGNNSGTAEIAAEAAGSGSQGDVRLRRGSVSLTFHGDSFRSSTGNSVDLGASSVVFKDIYGTRFLAGSINLATGGNKGILSEGGTRSSGGVLRIQDASSNPGTWTGQATTPSTISSNQNDYTMGSQIGYMQRWSSDASRDVTGISASQVAGQVHLIVNVDANDIVLKHESASSTAANRFLNSTGADITLAANQAADIIYDGTTQRWRVFKRN